MYNVTFQMGTNWVGIFQVIVGISSVIAAIFAIRYTSKSIEQQHTHNLKSVKPIPIICFRDLQTRITLRLENRGIGPLIVKKIVYILNDKKYHEMDELLHEEKIDTSIMFNTHVNGVAIRPNKVEKIIDYVFSLSFDEPPKEADIIRKVLSELEISITYSDIYGNEFPYLWHLRK